MLGFLPISGHSRGHHPSRHELYCLGIWGIHLLLSQVPVPAVCLIGGGEHLLMLQILLKRMFSTLMHTQ